MPLMSASSEYKRKDSTASWLSAYRLLCKGSPCIPEVAIRMAQLPAAMQTLEGRQTNFSTRMYGMYVEEKRQQVSCGTPIAESFLLASLRPSQNTNVFSR